MERLTEIKTHVTGFSYTDKKEGIFAQNVYAKLAAYEDTGLTPEQIQAQQQEIDRLKELLADWKYNTKCDADHIAALTADKDEQAGQLMRYDAVLKQAKEALQEAWGDDGSIAVGNRILETIKAIDALLGGKEDA